jgi:hypothetical protein
MERMGHDPENQIAARPPALLDLGCHTAGGSHEPDPGFT